MCKHACCVSRIMIEYVRICVWACMLYMHVYVWPSLCVYEYLFLSVTTSDCASMCVWMCASRLGSRFEVPQLSLYLCISLQIHNSITACTHPHACTCLTHSHCVSSCAQTQFIIKVIHTCTHALIKRFQGPTAIDCSVLSFSVLYSGEPPPHLTLRKMSRRL